MKPDDLGGRLPLLAPSELNEEQRRLYEAMAHTILPEAEHGGFVARLADGRFIGPFNALLHAPALAAAFGQWTAGIGRAGLTEEVRQVVILAVGAIWEAEYEVYAHLAAAHAEGIAPAAVEAILRRARPATVSADATVAYDLTVAIVEKRSVSQGVYDEALAAFGIAGVMAILSLIGQYQFVSSVLTCFQVPAPTQNDERSVAM